MSLRSRFNILLVNTKLCGLNCAKETVKNSQFNVTGCCDIVQDKYDASTLCLKKKLPTFKLSVTSSNLNRFSKFLHCWKAYEICYKTHMTLLISP